MCVSSRALVGLLVASVLGLPAFSACGSDGTASDVRGSGDGADNDVLVPPDSRGGDVAEAGDALVPDTQRPAAPDGTVWIDGQVLDHLGAPAPSWEIANPYFVTTSDADGRFFTAVSVDAPTLTWAAAAAGPARQYYLTTPSLAAEVALPQRLLMDNRATAVALVAHHPRLFSASSSDMARSARFARERQADRGVGSDGGAWDALSDAVAASQGDLEQPELLRAVGVFAMSVASDLSLAPQTRPVAVLPGDVGRLRVHSPDGTPAAALVAQGDTTQDDAAGYRLVSGRSALAVTRLAAIYPLDPGVMGVTTGRGLDAIWDQPDADPWTPPASALGPRSHLVAAASFDMDRAEALGAAVTIAVSQAWDAIGAVSPLSPGAGSGVLPARLGEADIYWLVSTSGAVAGAESRAIWALHPDLAWAALRTNLLREAMALGSPAGGRAPSPACIAAAAEVWTGDAVEAALMATAVSFDVAEAAAQEALSDVFEALVACEVAAGSWREEGSVYLLRRLMAGAGDNSGLKAPLNASGSARSLISDLLGDADGTQHGRLILRAEPALTPVVTGLSPELSAADLADFAALPALVDPGDRVIVSGRALGNVVSASWRDADGLVRDAAWTYDDASGGDSGGGTVIVPSGLAGALDLRLHHAEGRFVYPAAITIAPRVLSVEPSWGFQAAQAVPLRVIGQGLRDGMVITVGSATAVCAGAADAQGAIHATIPVDAAAGLAAGDDAVAVQGGPAGDPAIYTVIGPPELVGIDPIRAHPGQTVLVVADNLGSRRADLEVDFIMESDGAQIAGEVMFLDTFNGQSLLTVKLPEAIPKGAATLTLTTPSGSDQVAIEFVGDRPSRTRHLASHSYIPSVRQWYFGTLLAFANGTDQPEGDIWRRATAYGTAQRPYCPIDIKPDSVAIPAPDCAHPSGRCDDGWRYDDTSDPDTWYDIDRPPGVNAEGNCFDPGGPTSWEGVDPGDVYDIITTADDIDLTALSSLRGPWARLNLDNGHGDGFNVSGRSDGRRNEVTLDMAISDIDGTAAQLWTAKGVHIKRLEIYGTPGACEIGLRIVDSVDVRIDELYVEGCDIGVSVEGSRQVRMTAPATLIGNTRAVVVDDSDDLQLDVLVGVDSAGSRAPSGVQTDGVVIGGGSKRVSVVFAGASDISGDALRVEGSGPVRVSGVGVGWVQVPAFSAVGTAVGTAVRVIGDGSAVLVDGLFAGQGQAGVVAEGGDVVVRGGGWGAAAADGVGGFSDAAVVAEGGARVRVEGARFAGMTTAGPSLTAIRAEAGSELTVDSVESQGGHGCAIESDGVEVVIAGLDSTGDGSAICASGGAVIASDITVEGATDHGIKVNAGAALSATSLTIRGGALTGIFLSGAADVSIDGATVENTGGYAVVIEGAAGAPTAPVALNGIGLAGTAGGLSASATTGAVHAVSWGGVGGEPPTAVDRGVWLRDVAFANLEDSDFGGAASPSMAAIQIQAAAPADAADPVDATAQGGDGSQGHVAGLSQLAGVTIGSPEGDGVGVGDGLRILGGPMNTWVDGLVAGGQQAQARLALSSASSGLLTLENATLGDVNLGSGPTRIRGGQMGRVTRDLCDAGASLWVDGLSAEAVIGGLCGAPLLGQGGDLGLLSLGGGPINWWRGGVADEVALERQGGGVVADIQVGAVSLNRADLSPPTRLGAASRATVTPPSLDPAQGRLSSPWVGLGRGTPDQMVTDEIVIGGLVSGSEARLVDSGGATLAARPVIGGRAFFADAGKLLAAGADGVVGTLADGSSGHWRGLDQGEPTGDCAMGPVVETLRSSTGLQWITADGLADGTQLLTPARDAARCQDYLVVARGPDGARDLFLVDADRPQDATREVQLTTDPGDDYQPALTADCSDLVWVSDRQGQSDLFHLKLPVGVITPLTDDQIEDAWPSLALDGTLLWSRKHEDADDFGIYRAALDDPGTLQTPALWVDTPADELYVNQSHGGRWLAWSRCDTTGCEAVRQDLARGVVEALGDLHHGCSDRWPVVVDSSGALAVVRAQADRPGGPSPASAAALVMLSPWGINDFLVAEGVAAARPVCEIQSTRPTGD